MAAIKWNVLLMALFFLQHTIMATEACKKFLESGLPSWLVQGLTLIASSVSVWYLVGMFNGFASV